jgi:hypothetical protein
VSEIELLQMAYIPVLEKFEPFHSQLSDCDPQSTMCSEPNTMVGFDPAEGRIPRCLFIEPNVDNVKGAVIVGANPGKAWADEVNLLKPLFPNRQKMHDEWLNGVRGAVGDYCYYANARALVRGLGIEGHILWTEVYKCENKGSNGDFHPSVASVCSNKFLRNELIAFKGRCTNFQVFACGQNTFDFLNNDEWRELTGPIVGFYHPSGKFSRALCETSYFEPRKDYVLLDSVKSAISKAEKKSVFLKTQVLKDVILPSKA